MIWNKTAVCLISKHLKSAKNDKKFDFTALCLLDVIILIAEISLMSLIMADEIK
jgi:hypothetical protein